MARDLDAGDESFVLIQVGVAVRQHTHGEQIAVAQLITKLGQTPAEDHHVSRRESERQFLRWLVLVAFFRVRFQSVVNQLGGLKAVPVVVADGD